MAVNTIEELIQDIRQGRMVILMDDEDRENEGDLVMAAEMVRPEDINFMATNARGLICMPMSRARCERLKLPLMVENNVSGFGTKFTVSIEAAEGVTTGISAADRAHTVLTAASRNATAEDIAQPGHIFPLVADPGGVLSRAGHTEAACDMAQLAGFEQAGIICEVMNDDGTMARRPDLEKFAEKHNLKIGTIADLIHYRVLNEQTVECTSQRPVQTRYGEFVLHTYLDTARQEQHFVMVKGEINPDKPTLVRVHLSNTARDVLALESGGEYKSWTMHKALKKVADEGNGVVVLIYASETTAAVGAEISHLLGEEKRSSETASEVVYQQVGAGSQILRELGVKKMRLMSAPFKFNAISGFDLEVVEYIDCE